MRRWNTPDGLAFEDERTGDGRVFAPGSLRWEGDSWPLQWAREMGYGHDGAVLVGSIDSLARDGDAIKGGGPFDDESEDGAEAARLLDSGQPLGVSVDLDDVQVEFVARAGDMEDEDVLLASAVEQVRVTFDPSGRVVSASAPGLRALAASAGLVAAAGDPATGDDDIVLWEEASDDVLMRVVGARVRGATLVTMPAFDRAAIAFEPTEALVAAAIGDGDLPIADRDHEWDGAGAQERMRGEDDNWGRVAAGHFYLDDEADPETIGAYGLPFADVIDDTLTAVPAGIFAVAAALQGGRGGADVPEADQEAIRSAVDAYYERMAEQFEDPTIMPPWQDDAGDDSEGEARAASATCACGGTCGECGTHAVVASGAGRPPSGWFNDPALPELTPLSVEGGRVLGHIAGWGTCHTGSPAGACVTAPRSAANYAYFRTGVIETTDGDVPVGQVTIGGGHADLTLSYRGAAEHYDDTATAVADVAAGEDAHGIWVAGALRPGVTDEDVAALRAASPSGDWRSVGGALEMVAVHAVNVPGFPVARVASGRPAALVAAGALPVPAPAAEPEVATAGLSPEAARAMGEEAGKAFAAVLDRRAAAPHRRKLAALGAERKREDRDRLLARLRG